MILLITILAILLEQNSLSFLKAHTLKVGIIPLRLCTYLPNDWYIIYNNIKHIICINNHKITKEHYTKVNSCTIYRMNFSTIFEVCISDTIHNQIDIHTNTHTQTQTHTPEYTINKTALLFYIYCK